MRKVLLTTLIVFCAFIGFAQRNGNIKGVVYDTIANQPVSAATVTVVAKKDSSLVSFGMTDNAGRFEVGGIPDGDYRLLLTHVNFHNRNVMFSVNENSRSQDLGRLRMDDKSQVLEEVVVTNEAPPVTMVGDTVQYNAGSFKVQPNASVEQLLKKLPGIKVEKDGTVKAQGEKVSRVLVDGKEFFGNDPKMATKNLPADAIDKVQVYDKQSDQAELTGFEDGNYEKTINLKLKADKKKGVFGKVNAGGGTDGRFEGRTNINSFKGARQMSALAMANNTNAEGFSFMDILNFTGALGKPQSGGGAMNINISSSDASAMGLGGNNNGINTMWGGGINYNNIIGTKLDLQSSFFSNRISPDIERNVARQNFLPNGTNFYNENSYSKNINNTQRLNLNLLYQIDSMHSLRITPSISYQSSKTNRSNNYETLSESLARINNGISSNEGQSDGFNFSNNIMFRKKFARRGRTFSASLLTNINQMDGDGELNSITNFYNSGTGNIISRDTINQQYTNTGNLRGYGARLVYTEPILKRSLLEISIGKNQTRNTSEQITRDFNNSTGKFDLVNDPQTNDFVNSYGNTSAGLRIRTQKRKYNYSVGIGWQRAELDGKVISGIKDSVITKTFNNILANASFRYNISKFKSFSISYNSFTTQPTVSQLQPVADLSNRLNIRQGNPDLKQEYTHAVQGNLNLVSPYKNKNLFLFFNAQTTSNKIVNYDSLDVSGVRYSRPVNVDGIYNFSGSLSYSMPARFVKGTFEVSTRSSVYKSKQFINSFGNDINTWTLGPEVRLDMNPHEKLNMMISASVDYTKTKYSLASTLNTNYLRHEYSVSLDWQLPASFYFSSEFIYSKNSQRVEGYNVDIPIWNASISKQLLRYNRGELKLSVSDILNRSIGISRNTNQNYIEDVRVNTLRRFALLSFTYSLSKTGLNKLGKMRMIKDN